MLLQTNALSAFPPEADVPKLVRKRAQGGIVWCVPRFPDCRGGGGAALCLHRPIRPPLPSHSRFISIQLLLLLGLLHLSLEPALYELCRI